MTLTLEQIPITDPYEEHPPNAQYAPDLAYEVYGPENGYWRHDPNQVPEWLRDYHDHVTGVAHNYVDLATLQEAPGATSAFGHTAQVEEIGPDTEKFNAFWYPEADYPQSTPAAVMTVPETAPEPQTHTAHGRHRRESPPTLKEGLTRSLYRAAGWSIGLMLVPLCVELVRR